MFKIDYDHLKAQLDVQFILDMSYSDDLKWRQHRMSHCMPILIENIKSMLIGRQREGYSLLMFEGRNTLWQKTSSEPFEDDYCNSTLLIDYDLLYDKDTVFIDTSEFATIQCPPFQQPEYHLKLLKDYTAVRFIMKVRSVSYASRLECFADRSFHFEGVF